MRQRIQLGVVFFAWFMATGGQWDLTQLFAWGRMFAGYSREMCLSAAAEKTFSGEMCDLCKVVQQAKQDERDGNGGKTPLGKNPGKVLDLCLLATSTRIVAPVCETVGIVAPALVEGGRERAAPPLPPPRGLA